MGMQRHVIMYRLLQLAKRKTQCNEGLATQSESLCYLQAVPVLSLWQGVASKLLCPLMGSWHSE